MGHGWGQKGYKKTEAVRGRVEIGEGRGEKPRAMPVVVIDEEKEETHKTGYITLYAKLFKGVVCASQE